MPILRPPCLVFFATLVLGLSTRAIAQIPECAGLTALDLCASEISDLSPLATCTDLTELELCENQISDISPLSELVNLTYLDLEDNQISDITPLAELTKLEELHLGSNTISDLSPVSGLANLVDLFLESNQINDLAPLSELTNLQSLHLSGNSISELDPLAALATLGTLVLSANQIADISPLAELTSLSWLELDNNQITDIGPLVDNPGLGGEDGDYVNLEENPLNCAPAIRNQIPALEARGVIVDWTDTGQCAQVCVNAMNKSGEKVNRAQLKENEKCLKDHQKGKLAPMSFEECINADRKGKVQKAERKTERTEEKKCDPLAADDLPPFAYTDSTTVNQAAVEGALALAHLIFGDPVEDTDLFTNATNKDAAKCQKEMLTRAGKLENTVLKEINKAKKNALKEETTDSASALETALAAVLASSNNIAKKENQLRQSVDKKCRALQARPETIFPGACVDPDLDVIEDCVIAAARCEACLKINAFDALRLDCDQLDDGAVNLSCPLTPPPP